MIVSADSRIVRAISLGVFWRWAPSTRSIMWSRKLSPGLAVTRITIRSDKTLVPPVTGAPVAAGFPDDRRRLAGDGRLVHRGDALDDLAVGGYDLAGGDHHDVALSSADPPGLSW